MKKRALIIFNPHSGRKKGKQIADQLAIELNRHFDVEIISGISAVDASSKLANFLPSSDFVIAIGGDGLVNLVLQELQNHQRPIFVYPAGTGNDFFRHNFGKKTEIKNIVTKLIEGKVRNIDLALAKFSNFSKVYGQVLSAGFDSFVNRRANKIRYLPGTLKYVLALFLELPSFKPLKYELIIDGDTIEIEAMMVVVGNGPTYGGGMKVLPSARSDDGILDVMILKPVSKFELLRVFPKVFTGRHISHPQVALVRCRKITISSSAPVFADGEYLGAGKFSIGLLPNSLKVIDF